MLELEILYLWFSMIIGLTIIFQSWAKDPIIFQNRLKPKYSAYITLFAPVVIALAIPLFWVWTIWNVCNGIAHLIDIATEKD